MDVIIKVNPLPKARPRMTRSGQVYSTPEQKKNERHIKYELRSQIDRTMFECPLLVDVDFYITKPKSLPKKRKWPSKRPDLDNYIKQILDAGNNYIWADDACICEIRSRKLYTSGAGYIHLKVEEIKNGE